MTERTTPLLWVQALRGIAAMAVVLTHARGALISTAYWPFADWLLSPGAMGVDLFFILSGFIMVHSTADSDGSLRYVTGFAIKRFSRIWPVYTVLTLGWVLSMFGTAAFYVPANQVEIVKSLLFIPSNPNVPPYFGTTLAPGWTLNFEMYFYAVFALSMLFGRLRWIVLFAVILCCVVVAQSMSGSGKLSPTEPLGLLIGYLNLAANPLVLEFLAGVLIGLIYRAKWSWIQRPGIAWGVVVLSAVLVIWCGWIAGGEHGPLSWGWPLAALFIALAITSRTVNLPAPKAIVWLGEISFSLYLTNYITHVLAARWLAGAGLTSLTQNWGYVAGITVLCIIVGAASYYVLERGLSEAVRKMLMWPLINRQPTVTGLQTSG